MHRVRMGSRRKSPDPSNHRLQQLADEPIFHTLSPRARSPQLTLHPTSYQPPGFGQPGGWQTPYVTLTFQSTQTTHAIYEHYAAQASANGWLPTNLGPLGLPAAWQKPKPDGIPARLTLLRLGPSTPSSGLAEYRLTGSQPLAAS